MCCCSRLPGRRSRTQPDRSAVPGADTAPLPLDSHLTCCRSMKTSPTGGDSPAAILVQDLRAWAKYQPFSFTGRHPANLESGITCGERAGQGNVVGDCHPLPSAPVAPNPERPPWETSPAPPGQGCPSARCGEGVGMARTTLLWCQLCYFKAM